MATSDDGPGGLLTSHFSSFFSSAALGAPLPPSSFSFWSSVAFSSGSFSFFNFSLTSGSGGVVSGAGGAGGAGAWTVELPAERGPAAITGTSPSETARAAKSRRRIDFMDKFLLGRARQSRKEYARKASEFQHLRGAWA